MKTHIIMVTGICKVSGQAQGSNSHIDISSRFSNVWKITYNGTPENYLQRFTQVGNHQLSELFQALVSQLHNVEQYVNYDDQTIYGIRPRIENLTVIKDFGETLANFP